jgi:hypothetical protein
MARSDRSNPLAALAAVAGALVPDGAAAAEALDTPPANDPSPIASALTTAGIAVPADCVGIAIAPMDGEGKLQCVVQTTAFGAPELHPDGRMVAPVIAGSKSTILTVDKDGNASLYGRGQTDTVPHFWSRTGNPIFPWIARAVQSRQGALPGT